MRKISSVLSLSAITLFLFSSSLAIADPWKNESGHGKHRERGGSYYKYEEEYGDCKREYKRGRGGYKYEEKCTPEARHEGGPPPWAAAHGYRSKQRYGGVYGQDQHYEDTDSYEDTDPYEEYITVTENLGILHGTCNREALGELLGGVAGGALGTRVGKGDGKTIATIAGTVAGILVGRHIGRSMDQADQQCIGQILERAQDQQAVVWRNPYTGVKYEITPQKTYEHQGRYCREYLAEATTRGSAGRVQGMACRRSDGTWLIANQSGTL
ncbi:MAG: glycine zipper 2TM domain-containing protein [gamma proteobacterium endosymbiont of Lamellibrachia anaximandri]|nr:glycine zipper 2TM domain-containing protein [gamma proteobacterium endosymbiont of Lamellibrachia anaximandri]MBL3617638.1 glycine zipper 2TM domain-containing protein [gamma proteobacterium endosymbiont of Lamellibrachia anaximandri]